MNGLELAALIGVTAWLVVLTALVLVLVRQLAVLTVRLPVSASGREARSGLALGSPIPSQIREALPELADGPVALLLVSATCAPCKELIPTLNELNPTDRVVALLPGRLTAADEMAPQFPPWMRLVRDPLASTLASTLEIDGTPFLMVVNSEQVERKGFVRGINDFRVVAGLPHNVPISTVSEYEVLHASRHRTA